MTFLKRWWVIVLLILAFYVGKKWYQMPKFDDGERSPNFEWTLPSGEIADLKKLEGKYVLLDFWGSWCAPCIAEIPALVDLHQQFHGVKFKNANGFDIVGIGIEKDEKRWRRAIERYNLKWENHVFDKISNFKFFDSKIAKDYGIKEVPTKYLLDENGVIALVNPSPEVVREFLESKR